MWIGGSLPWVIMVVAELGIERSLSFSRETLLGHYAISLLGSVVLFTIPFIFALWFVARWKPVRWWTRALAGASAVVTTATVMHLYFIIRFGEGIFGISNLDHIEWVLAILVVVWALAGCAYHRAVNTGAR